MNHYECQKLFGAGRSLLESSRLVRYWGDSFASNDNETTLKNTGRGDLTQISADTWRGFGFRSVRKTWWKRPWSTTNC